MAIISIGPGAINRPTYKTVINKTIIDKTILANESGIINSVSVWFLTNTSGIKCGTFFGSFLQYTSRDYELLGDIAGGSKQIFSGLDCQVEIGDSLGIYSENVANIEASSSGGTNVMIEGDLFNGGTLSGYGPYSDIISIEGSGVTPGKNWQGITISKWNGALISKINNF